MKNRLIVSLGLVTLLFSLTESASALNPRRVFKKKCAKCHTIGKGDKTGPDLVNLENRRERAWVVNYILNSKQLIKSADKVALDLRVKYPKHKNHAFTKYKRNKMNQILEYIFAVGAGSDADIKAGKGSFSAGRFMSSSCVSCHGAAGYSRNPDTPHLRGQNAKYLVNQLKAFRDGDRVDSDESMSSMAQALTDRDIVNISTYYSELNNEVE